MNATLRHRLPRRRWIVESRPSAFWAMPRESWEQRLGPYFTERGARSMMRLCYRLSGVLLDWRVRDVTAPTLVYVGDRDDPESPSFQNGWGNKIATPRER